MRYPALVLVVILGILAAFLGEQSYSGRQTSAQTVSAKTWRVRAEPPILISSLSFTTAPSSDSYTIRLNILARLALSQSGAPKTVHVVALVSRQGPQEDIRAVQSGGYLELSYDVPATVKQATITIWNCPACTP
jgi:hypothetical protein